MNTKQFEVMLASGPSVMIFADYFTMDRGALCFRNSGSPYPETVTVFAPGAWSRVDIVRETS